MIQWNIVIITTLLVILSLSVYINIQSTKIVTETYNYCQQVEYDCNQIMKNCNYKVNTFTLNITQNISKNINIS